MIAQFFRRHLKCSICSIKTKCCNSSEIWFQKKLGQINKKIVIGAIHKRRLNILGGYEFSNQG